METNKERYCQKVCEICNRVPPGGWALTAPELDGTPQICTLCVFKHLTGNEYEWARGVK